jgi:hypothetical protein
VPPDWRELDLRAIDIRLEEKPSAAANGLRRLDKAEPGEARDASPLLASSVRCFRL